MYIYTYICIYIQVSVTRQRLGLEDVPTVLVVGGGDGVGKLQAVAMSVGMELGEYTYIHAYNACMRVKMELGEHNIHSYIHACMHACMHACQNGVR
jgi:hypothetical protein